MPIIYGPRVRLRAPERSDIPIFQKWVNDPEVTEHLTMIAPMGLDDETKWFEDMLQRPLIEHPKVIDVLENNQHNSNAFDWRPIGNVGFIGIDLINKSAEIGIMLGEKEYWNKGYGSETMQVMCKYGFESLNLHRIWLRVNQPNLRAIRAYEKVGFFQEGTYRDGHYLKGHYIDVLIMSVLKNEWNESTQKEG